MSIQPTTTATQTHSCPPNSVYITFTIDPLATLEYFCGELDRKNEIVANIHSHTWRTYVGFVEENFGGDATHDYTRLMLRPLQPGLTSTIDVIPSHASITPDMCVPLLPTTSHPLLRPPLQLTGNAELPKACKWRGNCYHATSYDSEILVPRTNVDYSSAISIDPSSRAQFSRYCKKDMERYLSGGVPEVKPATWSSLFNKTSTKGYFTPIVKISPDLSTVTELPNPTELSFEYDLLKGFAEMYHAEKCRKLKANAPEVPKPQIILEIPTVTVEWAPSSSTATVHLQTIKQNSDRNTDTQDVVESNPAVERSATAEDSKNSNQPLQSDTGVGGKPKHARVTPKLNKATKAEIIARLGLGITPMNAFRQCLRGLTPKSRLSSA